MFQAVDDYIQIKVESVSLPDSGSSVELFENLEEDGLTNDEQTVDEYIPATSCKIDRDEKTLGASSRPTKFGGFIDIILHPIYQVPCPYVRLFDGNGQPASDDAIQMLIYSQRNTRQSCNRVLDNRHSSSSTASDNIPYPFDDGARHLEVDSDDSKFTYEEHPYLRTTCLCLHVCGVGDRLGLIDSTVTQAAATMDPRNFDVMDNDSDSNCHRNEGVNGVNSEGKASNADIYFLNWFMLVAHKIGFQVTASFYQDASSSLCHQTDSK